MLILDYGLRLNIRPCHHHNDQQTERYPELAKRKDGHIHRQIVSEANE
jgi:hypothetical protein